MRSPRPVTPKCRVPRRVRETFYVHPSDFVCEGCAEARRGGSRRERRIARGIAPVNPGAEREIVMLNAGVVDADCEQAAGPDGVARADEAID